MDVWIIFVVYISVFVLIGFAFQWIDWSKILKKEYKKNNLVIYIVATICVTFLIGSLILVIMGA